MTNLEKMISSKNFLFINEIIENCKNCKNCLISKEEIWYFDINVKINEKINKTYSDHLHILLFSNSIVNRTISNFKSSKNG